MYLGIAFISTPKYISQAGIVAAAFGFLYIVAINVYCVYILLKARNRFKREVIVDICDLAALLYGEWIRPIMSILLILTNSMFLICYIMYIGTQTD
jgi:amino acid permease